MKAICLDWIGRKYLGDLQLCLDRSDIDEKMLSFCFYFQWTN